MGVDVRLMRPEDHEEMFRLYGEAFGADGLAAFRTRFRWEFFDNPRAAREASRAWLAFDDEDGRLLGHVASFPMLLKVRDGELMTSSSGDIMVSASARGRGIGETVAKAYRDAAGVLATDGFGYQPVTGRIYSRLGYQGVDCVPMYLRPMDLVPLVRFAIASGRLPKWTRNPVVTGLGLIAAWIGNLGLGIVNAIRRPSISGQFQLTPVTKAGPEFDEFWRRVSPSLTLAFVRDAAWIQWRYLDDPVTKHELLAARDRDGKLEGFVVHNISERPGLRIVRVMDLLAPLDRPDVVEALIAGVVRAAKAAGAGAINCWGLHPRLRAEVRRYLYLQPRGEQDPSLLYCTGDDALKALVYDGANWHVTRGDGDEGLAP